MGNRGMRFGLVAWLSVSLMFGQALLPGGSVREAKAAPVFHLPWEAGSVWQITYDGNASHHADEWNRYAFDAVPDPNRSTRQVTAIANGHVLGFQNDVPNQPRTPGPHAGNCMLIRHEDGTVSLYAHLASGSIPENLRYEGAEVHSGMVIGTVGMSGYSFGEHLHWSLTSDGHMYEQYGYRTCLGHSIPSQYADNDRELIEDGGVPRPGRFYESTNVVGGSAQEPPAPTVAPVDVAPTEAPTTSEGAQAVETAPMDIGATGPDGHAIGAQFTVTTTAGAFLGSCTLEGNPAEQHLVTCQVPVPRGTTVIVTLDENTIPAGLAPVENPLTFNTSGDPGAASHWGISFQLQPQGSDISTGQTSDVAIVTTENGSPVYDACFVLVNFSNEGCDRNSDGQITFEDVPLGTYALHQTADLGSGRSVPDSTITITGVADSDGWERFPVSVGSGQSSGSTNANQGGVSDIAIVTTENGQPAYDVCFVLVNFSNEGCDRNSDGKITFEDVPVGTYTLRQTADLGSGRSIPDTTIQVTGVADADGWERFSVSVNASGSTESPGSTQNTWTASVQIKMCEAPPTNGSADCHAESGIVVNISLASGEFMGSCTVGEPQMAPWGEPMSTCAVDGMPFNADFVATQDPATIPAGYVPIEASSTFHMGSEVVWGGDQATFSFTNVRADTARSTGASNTATGTTLLITLRGCPEGFDPSNGNFAAECTIPLDAPNNAFLDHGGDGQGGWFISQLDRQYDGTYVYTPNPQTMNVKLRYLDPSVRDAYEVVGADTTEEGVFSINLIDGETREVFIYYYYT